jgi:hypothetical protein
VQGRGFDSNPGFRMAAAGVAGLAALFTSATVQDRTIRFDLLPDWDKQGFDDAEWSSSMGGFGTGTVTGSKIVTDWWEPACSGIVGIPPPVCAKVPL